MSNQITDDESKHKQSESPQRLDEESVLGSTPSEVEDIDETLKSVGLPSDEDGPKELNIEDNIK